MHATRLHTVSLICRKATRFPRGAGRACTRHRGVSALASMFGLVLDFGAVFPAAVLEASAASLSTRLVSHAITGSHIALHPFGQAQRRQVDERCDRRASMRALQRLFTARELLEQRLALRHAQGIAEHDGAPARLGG